MNTLSSAVYLISIFLIFGLGILALTFAGASVQSVAGKTLGGLLGILLVVAVMGGRETVPMNHDFGFDFWALTILLIVGVMSREIRELAHRTPGIAACLLMFVTVVAISAFFLDGDSRGAVAWGLLGALLGWLTRTILPEKTTTTGDG